jgi:ribose transport system ATP-binding protein
LLSKPRVILAHEPTQGVDVGSRLELYRLLRKHVDEGAAGVVVSSDAAELEGLCDRVLVMSRGQIARRLSGEDVTEERMTEVALTAAAVHPARAGRRDESPLRRFLGGDLAPAAGVLGVTLLLGLYTYIHSATYLTPFNFNSLLSVFAILAFAAMAQQMVMITGGIDLSVGPLMGFLLVVGSFWLVPQDTYGLLLLGGLGLLALAAIVAVFNWIPTLIGLPAFVVTLVTFTALQGLALYYRPSPGGTFHPELLQWLRSSTGWVPWAAAAAVVTSVILEVVLRRTKWGAQLRAIGSAADAAHDAGIRVNRVRLIANLLAAALVVCASVLLIAEVGTGDATVGIGYTLAGITAVIIGGASIFGGRGSFVGAVAGALLIQQINTSTVFLGFGVAWQSYLLGGLTLVAAGLYSRARGGIGHAR